jgi:hypothetical protein
MLRFLKPMVGALLALCLGSVAEAGTEAAPPPSTIAVALGSGSETIWPFTGTDFSGGAQDPINLIFTGTADPRTIRDVLMSLDGNRTAFGFPNAFPFNCTWSDAFGDEQVAWAAEEGWQGSAVQLQCGSFSPMRFHLRLFREGIFSLANVHFDLLIPGTADHEVLSWEIPEALVTVDLVRSGFLTAAPLLTEAITPAPSYRTIRTPIFNGIPLALRAAFGLPLTNQSAPVPIPNDGRATVLSVQHEFEPSQSDIPAALDLLYNQIIPRPFCSSGPLDLVKVEGPVHLSLRVHTNPSGTYTRTGAASALLTVTPVDPLGQPTGPSVTAEASEVHRGMLTTQRSEDRFVVLRLINSDPPQSLVSDLSAGDSDRFFRTVVCGSQPEP